MAVVDVSNIAFVVEPTHGPVVVDDNALAVTVEVPPQDVQVEFTSAATLVPGPGLEGGGYMIGEVHINLTDEILDKVNGASQLDDLAAVALSGSYNDLSDLPAPPAAPPSPWIVGMGILWYGAANAVPLGWLLCDGTNGTPDMRGKVPIGASGSRALGSTAGSANATGTTGLGGAHTPTGSIGGTALDSSQIPEHGHFTAKAAGGTSINTTITATTVTDADTPFGGDSQYRLRQRTGTADVGISSKVGSGAAHGHPLTLNAVDNHTHPLSTISVMQPDRAWHFIIYAGV